MNNIMNYAILRVQKLKTNTAVRGSLKHAFREQNTPNADPTKASENTHLGASSVAEGMTAFKDRLPDKIRKNGVRCVEYLMTASPEKMKDMTRQEQDAFFSDSLDWLKNKHGEENVVYSGIHRDETTPHMYAYVVPIDEKGKLNCRKFLGGTKHVLSELQDDFAKQVGNEHGMDRGVKGSKAKHVTIQKYYADLDKTANRAHEAKQPQLLKKGFVINKLESKSDIIDRVADQNASMHRHLLDEERRKENSLKTIKSMEQRLKELQPVSDLPREEKEKLLDLARENQKRTREKQSRTRTKKQSESQNDR